MDHDDPIAASRVGRCLEILLESANFQRRCARSASEISDRLANIVIVMSRIMAKHDASGEA